MTFFLWILYFLIGSGIAGMEFERLDSDEDTDNASTLIVMLLNLFLWPFVVVFSVGKGMYQSKDE